MEKKQYFTVSMTKQEQFSGLCYLAFQSLLLPSLLDAVLTILVRDYSIAVLNLLFFAVNFVMSAFLFRRFLKRSWDALPETLGSCIWKAALALLGCKVAVQLLNCLLWLCCPQYFVMTSLGPVLQNPNDQHIAEMAAQYYLPFALATVFLVPPVEELLHRGTVFGTLHAKNRGFAWVVSVFLFSAIHVIGYLHLGDSRLLFLCFLQYIFPAVALCRLYETTGSIFAPILMHMAYNAIGILFVR